MNKTNKILLFSKSDIKLSENIRTLRKNAGWSQEELGEKLGVTKNKKALLVGRASISHFIKSKKSTGINQLMTHA